MIQRLRTLLFSIAAASLLANGAHALTGPSAERPSSGVDPQSIRYARSGSDVTGVSFQMATAGKPVRIRVNPTDGWHLCASDGDSVTCSIPSRPVTLVNELEIQTI